MALPFTIINLDKPREMRLGMKAMVEFERTTKIKLTEIDDNMSIEACSKLLYTMLKQQDQALTLDKTIELMDEYVTPEEAVEAVTECIYAAFPKQRPQSPNVRALPMDAMSEEEIAKHAEAALKMVMATNG